MSEKIKIQNSLNKQYERTVDDVVAEVKSDYAWKRQYPQNESVELDLPYIDSDNQLEFARSVREDIKKL